MSADVIHDPNYPHGTPAGYTNGCRGSHCPNRITCRAVHIRYVGDYTFRKQFDAGLSAAEIVKREQEALQRALDERKAQKRVVLPPTKNKPAKRRTTEAGANNANLVRQLHKHGWHDGDIATELGIGTRSICNIRKNLNLKSIRTINEETIRTLHPQGLTDTQIANRINETRTKKIDLRAVAAIRRRLKLPLNTPRGTT